MPATTATNTSHSTETAAVAAALSNYPECATARLLADDTGLSEQAVRRALAILVDTGAATRTPGTGRGKRRIPDTWTTNHTTTNTGADDGTVTATDPTANDAGAGLPALSDPPIGQDTTNNPAIPDHDSTTANGPDQADQDRAVDNQADNSQPDAPTTDAPTTDATGADSNTTGTDEPAATTTADDSASRTADTTATGDNDRDPAPASPAPVGSDTGTTNDPDAAPVEAPVSGPPAAPRQPDLKVMIMASVLGDHPDGVTASDAITASGLAPATGDTILAAMEVAGAARRLPAEADGTELWVRGDADLSTVDPANAPTHVTCPTCGHVRRIRRPSARRASGTGNAAPEINSDGSTRLAKNGLRHQVEAFLRDLGNGHDVTPGTVARELGGRSSGAVANAMDRLSRAGVLVLSSEAPVMYALRSDAPAPTPEVIAYMTQPVLNDNDTGTGTTAPTAPTDADDA